MSLVTVVVLGLTVGFLIWPYGAALPKGVKAVPQGMQVLVSIAILSCALYIVLSHSYAAQDKHWAYGSLGTILGYWLKPK